MAGSGREALLNVREWSGDPLGFPADIRSTPGYPEVVGRPSQVSVSYGESLPNFREW